MSYWGESLSLLCAVFWAIAVIFLRLTVRDIPAIEIGLFKNLLAFVFFFLTWLIIPDWDHQVDLNASRILRLFVAGMIGTAIGDTLYIHSLKLIGASRSAIIGCLFSPFVILLSFLFLDERFSLNQFFGFLIILLGVFLSVYQRAKHKISKQDLTLGISLCVIAIFSMATAMVITKPAIADSSPVQAACIRLTGAISGLLLYTMVSGRYRRSIQVFNGPIPWTILIAGSFFSSYLALFTWVAGFKHTSASIASILNQTSVLFILIFAAIFLKERLSPLKIVGALLGFGGVILIFIHA